MYFRLINQSYINSKERIFLELILFPSQTQVKVSQTVIHLCLEPTEFIQQRFSQPGQIITAVQPAVHLSPSPDKPRERRTPRYKS